MVVLLVVVVVVVVVVVLLLVSVVAVLVSSLPLSVLTTASGLPSAASGVVLMREAAEPVAL